MSNISQPKLPLIEAIRNDRPLPQVKIGPRRNGVKLRAATDEFMDGNSFNSLIGVGDGVPNPTTVHHAVSDVANSIESSINRTVALVLFHGHAPNTFTMDSTMPDYDDIIHDCDTADPSQIVGVPDWVAYCKWEPSSDPNEHKTSTLALLYKDRGLACADEFINECKQSCEPRNEIADQLDDMDQLEEELRRGEGQRREAFKRLIRPHGRYNGALNTNASGSTLGLKHPCAFSKNVDSILQEATACALRIGTPYVGVSDYQSLLMFEYVDLKKQMLENETLRTNDIARLRAGPGNRVDVVIIKDDENQSRIRRVMLGAWLQAIRGL
ncbi:hypothetical protein LX32DRAFT_678342 [Colletotrichum zoysiae]|uniref:Uncharacterized protein n=1 Tax=Colletotrichum zoysiae TaxID=1216348 RepID=A0AAD9M6Q6_9PEZI|nr:hypothetical protein LX32DRAFT_678342 [Colletotrichum zoysiae]